MSSLEEVEAELAYCGPYDPEHPEVIVKVGDAVPEFLVAKIMKEGFIVETDKTGLLTISAGKKIRQLELTAQLVGLLEAWHEEYCGYTQYVRPLVIRCEHKDFRFIRYVPDERSAAMRLATLRWKQAVALFIEEYGDVATLQREIDALIIRSRV